ncbi:Na(+)/H(+) exchange regulatory cofactor NHE-RF2 [Carcharodon carcharias]|uniref:Na(+)/H(+) exchange regulatory cofactor NHE-RF2 n=1 Tax=Carcharodon carcharias TaxID=13397 RepID=UPI001B7E2BB6|nr:Na(+)/H(+) exchange regulatory cofactor NHE-RF2 [Carcharodon carcharias]
MAKDHLKPRLCHMIKGENGYGFHLHGEKGKNGQYIRKVEPGSAAEAAGLCAGDRVVEVNGENVEKETHSQVVQRIKALENETRLLVVDKETDEYLHNERVTGTEDYGQNLPPDKTKDNGEVWKQQVILSSEETIRLSNRSIDSNKKEVNGQTKELCPRLCCMKKCQNGYGFNLHSEKAKPGQYIRSVDPDSCAAKAGLRAQDRVVEVNGVNIEGKKHSEVVACIKACEEEARLLVVDPETDQYFKKLGITPTESHLKGPLPQPLANGSPRTLMKGDLDNDPFAESGLNLSPTAAETREKMQAKRKNKRAPPMDWNKKHEIFSNF